ncbi:MAG: phage tail sheath family protein [Oscillospiraceae bacterium]|jgi:hypothetical protein|nr:phage tail sheath family protein [Oscillospiraceae bacterium]
MILAGGTFDVTVGKVRPGTYINFLGNSANTVGTVERGTVLLPLLAHDYGPGDTFICLDGSNPDAAVAQLGYSVFDAGNDGMLMIREAMKNAKEVLVYLPAGGSAAETTVGNLTVKAKYAGRRGEDFKVVVEGVPANEPQTYNVFVFLGTMLVFEKRGVSSVAELSGNVSDWVVFEGEGPLSAAAGVNLEGGANATVSDAQISAFLSGSESYQWQTLAWPYEDHLEQVKAKIKYLREEAGMYRKAVCTNFAADYEGIINVTNAVKLADGRELDAYQAAAWVAGADAGAGVAKSLTYKEYQGAVAVVEPKNHAAAVEAIQNGEFFFASSDAGKVVVEYDINSLTASSGKDMSYCKNRILRVFDSFAEAVKLNFPPNKFDNSPAGWIVMEGEGKALLKQFEGTGAIANVDYDTDFLVNRNTSRGDSTYFNVGLQAVDSAEKLYFEIQTR